MVEGHAGDPSKVTASGPGLQPVGNVINRPTFFDIFTKDAGRGVPEVVVLDPQVFKNLFQKAQLFLVQNLGYSTKPENL